MLFDDSPTTSLTGIARLAARSPVLEAKSRVQYFEIETRSVLNRTRPGMPFRWTINPYRGCEFGCKYCYARYTHEFMGLDDSTWFEDRIYAAKANWPRFCASRVAPHGSRGLHRHRHRDRPVSSRPSGDSGVRVRFWKCLPRGEGGGFLHHHSSPDLVARDVDLLQQIGMANAVSVNITVTTLDRELARLLEPRAPRPDLRLKAVRRLADAGIRVGVFPNPILPLITDSELRLDQLARAARGQARAIFGGGLLFLMPAAARRVFFPFSRRATFRIY